MHGTEHLCISWILSPTKDLTDAAYTELTFAATPEFPEYVKLKKPAVSGFLVARHAGAENAAMPQPKKQANLLVEPDEIYSGCNYVYPVHSEICKLECYSMLFPLKRRTASNQDPPFHIFTVWPSNWRATIPDFEGLWFPSFDDNHGMESHRDASMVTSGSFEITSTSTRDQILGWWGR